jgi:hypothetical protein
MAFPADDPRGASIFTALPEQSGLKLKSARSPINPENRFDQLTALSDPQGRRRVKAYGSTSWDIARGACYDDEQQCDASECP